SRPARFFLSIGLSAVLLRQHYALARGAMHADDAAKNPHRIKPDGHRQLHEFDHIYPALAALDAGDRRLRLADALGNVALAQPGPDALGDQDLNEGGVQRRLNCVHSAGLTITCRKCQYRINDWQDAIFALAAELTSVIWAGF